MESLLEARQLCVDYPLASGVKSWFSSQSASLRAVNNVSFGIPRGRALGVVGESGCGKSTLGRALIGFEQPSSGEVLFNNKSLYQLDKTETKQFRRRVQMIFQEPVTALNPRLTIRQALQEIVKVHRLCEPSEQQAHIEKIADQDGFPLGLLDRRPNGLSGGQCQRAGIARALMDGAELLIADEQVSALDVSVQAQVMNLFNELRHKFDLTLLFISHDLGVVRYVCDYIAVMYLGRIVEYGPANEVFNEPRHPYTQALIAAIPRLDQFGEDLPPTLEGDPPSPVNQPQGCPFYSRCPQAFDKCKQPPPRHHVENTDVWCH